MNLYVYGGNIMDFKKEGTIWSNGEFMPWAEARTHPIGQGLHYGLGVFEGIRFYATAYGPAVFRLQEHLTRLMYSAQVLRMTEKGKIKCMDRLYSPEDLIEIIKELIRRNRMQEGYIRPIFFYGGGNIGLDVKNSLVEGAIEIRPWLNPKREFLKAKTCPYRRIDPRSTDVNAKICGHYVNSFLARLESDETGFEEAILLDLRKYVSEASVENIFAIRDGILYTPRLGTILPGVTRDTIITLARNLGLKVKERNLRMKFFKEADEVLLCGTAMEILAIGEIDGKPIGNGGQGPLTRQLTALYKDVVEGRVERYFHWLTFVNK